MSLIHGCGTFLCIEILYTDSTWERVRKSLAGGRGGESAEGRDGRRTLARGELGVEEQRSRSAEVV